MEMEIRLYCWKFPGNDSQKFILKNPSFNFRKQTLDLFWRKGLVMFTAQF